MSITRIEKLFKNSFGYSFEYMLSKEEEKKKKNPIQLCNLPNASYR